ncbi:short-chain dehydrogenase/reductase SDR [Microdochium trichocladiopsis]|uniref:Short-chain dehydrogenase/reductase SDR n=1 Tax=Microdochium trichocladiopsis TaxID=1682393 RepID=A0A9P9BR73_9PEZI|nr:short-chain dehydrogenase/reductase SDR [Microdochium trichocladiopsis]KAH7031565.1 short-chain dehydrogenase/reductase SDR [Microdochium trichocladiopsis]
MASAGKTIALVTGANQGVGLAVSKILSSDHGYHVIMAGRREQAVQASADQLKKQGLDVEPLVLDLGSDSSIDAAVDYVQSHYGVIDVLVNNAGIARASDPAADSRTTYETVLGTNVVGTMSVTEKFLPLLAKSQKTKRVVFVSSGSGSMTNWATPGSLTRNYKAPAYAVSKSALNALCLQYAVEYEDDPTWKFNAGCPGYCSTNLNGFSGSNAPETGAQIICKLATLDNDGPSGVFMNRAGRIPW